MVEKIIDRDEFLNLMDFSGWIPKVYRESKRVNFAFDWNFVGEFGRKLIGGVKATQIWPLSYESGDPWNSRRQSSGFQKE